MHLSVHRFPLVCGFRQLAVGSSHHIAFDLSIKKMSTTISGKLRIISIERFNHLSLLDLDVERINHLEWRLKRLENFIGKSDQSQKKRVRSHLHIFQ